MFARQLVDKALQLNVGGLVVGMPLDPWNPESTLTSYQLDTEHGRKCRNFANSLALVARPHGLHVYLFGGCVVCV